MLHAYLDAVICFKELQEPLFAWVRVGEAGTLGTQLNLSAKVLASPCAGHGQSHLITSGGDLVSRQPWPCLIIVSNCPVSVALESHFPSCFH